MDKTKKSLGQLAVPICLETLLFMMAGTLDTLMLSSVNNQAVGAVGTANTYISMFLILFSVISTGMMAVMTQNIGAGRPGIAYQARQLGAIINLSLSIVIGLLLALGSGPILKIVGIADALYEPAKVYLQIVGGCCFLNALIPVFSGYLRSFGHMHHSMVAGIVGNVLNLILNAVFLFGFHMGVVGVALATVISRVVNLIIVIIASIVLIKAKDDTNRIPMSVVFRQMLQVGFPAAMETAIYNFAMTLVIRYMNQMDPDGINVTARSYASQITSFSYCIGFSLAQANAIMTGWRIGAKEFDACDKGTKKAAVLGIICSFLCASAIALFGKPIISLFTDDSGMIRLVYQLLLIDIFLEVGRCSNLVFGFALKTSGDASFPVALGAVFMMLCAVGGTYLFGIELGLLAVGAYIGLASDECIRGVAMFLRWQSGKWQSKIII